MRIEPVEIVEENDYEISISWADGAKTAYTAAQLRKVCPCAQCVNEWTGERMLDQASIPDSLKAAKISIVGRYALNFVFSDNHETGIYTFDFLRNLTK